MYIYIYACIYYIYINAYMYTYIQIDISLVPSPRIHQRRVLEAARLACAGFENRTTGPVQLVWFRISTRTLALGRHGWLGLIATGKTPG